MDSLCREHGIGLNGIYNADQFGLLYKQYPNRVIIEQNQRSTFRGVKAMKDKNRISVMACANAIGEKVPLAVCGKHKRPMCFNLVEGQLPLPYTSQSNSWYSQEVMKWWFKYVFKRYVQPKHGDDHIILILDNLDAHKALKNWYGVPKNIHIMFLPPNLTSKYQPMDQGVIATVKLGYKMLMLKFLLVVCDDVALYEEYQNLEVPKGCRGLEHGSAPHILDALRLLKMLWEGDLQGRYSNSEAIARCWRKSNCLPLTMITELNKDFGRSDINTKSIDDETLNEMCDLISGLQVQVTKMANIPSQLQESIVCVQDLNREELIEGLQFHRDIDELPILEDVLIDESITQLMQSLEVDHKQIKPQIREEPNFSDSIVSTNAATDIASTLELLQKQILSEKLTDDTQATFRNLACKVKTELINKRNISLKQQTLFSFFKTKNSSLSTKPTLQNFRDCSPASTLTNSSHSSSLLKRPMRSINLQEEASPQNLDDFSEIKSKYVKLDDNNAAAPAAPAVPPLEKGSNDISFHFDPKNPGEINVDIRYYDQYFKSCYNFFNHFIFFNQEIW